MDAQKWEYKIHIVKELNTEELLNNYGEDGWELVGVSSETADHYETLYLKRRRGK